MTAATTIHNRRSMFGIVLLRCWAVVTLALYMVTAIDASLGRTTDREAGNIPPIRGGGRSCRFGSDPGMQ